MNKVLKSRMAKLEELSDTDGRLTLTISIGDREDFGPRPEGAEYPAMRIRITPDGPNAKPGPWREIY